MVAGVRRSDLEVISGSVGRGAGGAPTTTFSPAGGEPDTAACRLGVILRGMTDDTLTVNAYLDEWFALQRTRIEPTTWANYRLMARYYLRPFLGERRPGAAPAGVTMSTGVRI
jgi:hypothetical protein